MFIITTLCTILLTIWAIHFVPYNIKYQTYLNNTQIAKEAILNNDLTACLAVKSDFFCKSEIAIKNNNTELCYELPDNSDDYIGCVLYICLVTIAENTGNNDICFEMDIRMKDKTAGERCRRRVKATLIE